MGVVIDHVPNHVAGRAGRAQPAVVGDAPRRLATATRRAGSTSTGTPADGKVDPAGARRSARRRSSTRWRSSTASCASARSGSRSPRARPTSRRPRRSIVSTTACSTGSSPDRNVRRFFTIDDLVAVRVEDPVVAAAVDTVPRLLADHEAFAGVRVDHIDGLADPLRLPGGTAPADRRRSLAAGREDPRPRRAAARVVAGGRHDRLRARRGARARPARCRRLGPAAPALGRRDRRPPAVPRLGARCSPRGARGRAAAGPRAGRPRRRRPSRRRRGHGRGSGRRAQRAPRSLPHLPPRRRGRSGADARPRRGRGEPAAPGAGARSARHRAARQRRRRGRRVAHPMAAAHRPGDGQGRRGSGVLALRDAGVARRGRRVRRATGRTSIRSPPSTSTTRRRRRGGRRRCWPGRPTTPSAPRTSVPPAWRSPRGSRRFVELVDEWFDGPGSRFAIDLSIQWLALQTVVTTPGLDGSTAVARSSSRPAGRPTCTRPGRIPTSRTSASSAGSPTSCCSGRRLPSCSAELDGPGRAATLAMLAVRLDRAWCRRHLPGDRGVPVPARRPGQPQEPDHDALDELVRVQLALDGRSAWAEAGSPAARAVGDPARSCASVTSSTSSATCRWPPASSSSPSPASIVPASRCWSRSCRGWSSGQPALTVELPPGEWRHVLVDERPGRHWCARPSTTRSMPSRRSSLDSRARL